MTNDNNLPVEQRGAKEPSKHQKLIASLCIIEIDGGDADGRLTREYLNALSSYVKWLEWERRRLLEQKKT